MKTKREKQEGALYRAMRRAERAEHSCPNTAYARGSRALAEQLKATLMRKWGEA